MARYKKHYVSYGDTIQSIAHTTTGDVSGWREIVRYNNLTYPYIVDTVEEKLQNPEHWVTYGDLIIVPYEASIGEFNPSNLNNGDVEQLYASILGIDLDVMSEDFTITTTDKKDLKTSSGIDNLKQAIIMQLLTPRGSLLMHPRYGSDLHYMFSKATAQNAIIVENEIVATIKQDPRVESVSVVSSTISGDTYSGEFIVNIPTLEDSFNLLVTNDILGNMRAR